MERHGIAIVVEDAGVQVQRPQPCRVERQALLMGRKTGLSLGGQAQGARVASSNLLHFFWRIFARVAGYVTRIRCFLTFKLAKNGSLEVKEERRKLGINENKVEEGLVQASTTCEPELAEILVTCHRTCELSSSELAEIFETTNHGIHDADTKVEGENEDCGSKCIMGSQDMDQESAPLACIVEQTSAMEQSVACEPIDVILPELDGEECTAIEAQKCPGLEQNAPQEEQNDMLCTPDGEVKCHSLKQNDSRDEELVNAVINNKSDALQLSSDSNTGHSEKGSSDVEAVEVISSSQALKKRVSIMDLSAVVAEQLTKCLHALEQNMILGKAEHRRAIILATLVAIIVWARNAKHLHESMPRIRRSAINVHIRSRL